MTTFVDGAATFAPVTGPLRDWLREQPAIVAAVATDTSGLPAVYAGGRPANVRDVDTVIACYAAGGTSGGTGLDRPFMRFDVWAKSAETAEQVAHTLRSVLDHAAGAVLAAAADVTVERGDVRYARSRNGEPDTPPRLVGADTAPPIWAPDPDDNSPRFVVTTTLTVQAVSI